MTKENMTKEEAYQYLQKEYKEAIERAKRTGHYGKTKYIQALEVCMKALETVEKYKDLYNKGWEDGAKAVAFHNELCEEEGTE